MTRKRREGLRIVALLENNPYPRDVRVRPHMEALAAEGHRATVICPRDHGQRWRETVNEVDVYRFPSLTVGSGKARYIWEFVWATVVMTVLALWVWKRQGMDVLHIYNPPESLFVAGLLPKLAGKTIVYDVRDIAPELFQAKFEDSSPVLNRTLLGLEYVMCHLADHVVVVNESYRRILLARDHVPPARVSVVRQAPDLDQVHPVEPDPDLRSRAGTIIGYMGSMAGQDGIDHLLEALRQLDQRFGHADWFCALIGPAEDQQSLVALSAELGLSDRTWFQEYLPMERWLPLLSAADVCVEPCPSNPINSISTMNKIMDYMALGKPVVAYDLPEHRFTAGEAALYARPNDQVDFARQILRLIEDPELRSQLGAIGRERMEQLFAWPYQRQNLINIYETLARKNETA